MGSEEGEPHEPRGAVPVLLRVSWETCVCVCGGGGAAAAKHTHARLNIRWWRSLVSAGWCKDRLVCVAVHSQEQVVMKYCRCRNMMIVYMRELCERVIVYTNTQIQP